MIRTLSTILSTLGVIILTHSVNAHATERLVGLQATEVNGLAANCDGPAPFLVSFDTKRISKNRVSFELNGKTRRVARGKAARFVTKKIDGGIGRQFTTTIHAKRGVQVTEVAIDLESGASCKFSFDSGRIG